MSRVLSICLSLILLVDDARATETNEVLIASRCSLWC